MYKFKTCAVNETIIVHHSSESITALWQYKKQMLRNRKDKQDIAARLGWEALERYEASVACESQL